jgi:hypothetical protein
LPQVVELVGSDRFTHSGANHGAIFNGGRALSGAFPRSQRAGKAESLACPAISQPILAVFDAGGINHGGGTGESTGLLELPLFAILASRWPRVRLTVARIVIFAAALTFKLLLGQQRTDTD